MTVRRQLSTEVSDMSSHDVTMTLSIAGEIGVRFVGLAQSIVPERANSLKVQQSRMLIASLGENGTALAK